MTSKARRRAAGAADRGPSSLISRTTGTNIGSLTTGVGLAGAFDGVTNQINSSSARQPGVTTSYIGKTTAVPTAIESVTTFGSNDRGYLANNNAITITLYGKQGSAPSGATDGTPLGSISFTDTGNESTGRQINSSDTATYWDHVWIHLSTGSSTEHYMAELQMTGWQ